MALRAFALALLAGMLALPAVERTVLCYGDSITYATSKELQVGDGTRWTDVLPTLMPGVRTVNAGKNGRTTEDAAGLQDALKKNPDPAVVILLLGVNDLKGAGDPAAAAAATARRMGALLDIVAKAAPRAEVLLCAPLAINEGTLSAYWKGKGFGPGTSRALVALEDAYRTLAAERKVGFASLLHAVTPANLSDGVHPDAAGHRELAQALAAALAPAKAAKAAK